MTKISLSTISKEFWNQIYTGLEKGCRCGCHGKYFKHGDAGFARAINKAYRLNPEIILCENDEVDMNASRIYNNVWRNDSEIKGYGLLYQGKTEWIDIVLPGGTHLKTITLFSTTGRLV